MSHLPTLPWSCPWSVCRRLLQASGWTDVEADLPLTYTYYASGLLLAQGTTSTAVHVRR